MTDGATRRPMPSGEHSMKSYDLIIVGAGSGNMLLGPAARPSANGDHRVRPVRWDVSQPGLHPVEDVRRCRRCGPGGPRGGAARGARDAGSGRLACHRDGVRPARPAARQRGPVPAQERDRRLHAIGAVRRASRARRGRRADDCDADRRRGRSHGRSCRPSTGWRMSPYHTSDTIMRIEKVPCSMLVIGGGFIAAELGHVFGAFGASVTIAARGPRLLMAEDEDVSARFTDLAQASFPTLLLDTTALRLRPATAALRSPSNMAEGRGSARQKRCSSRPDGAPTPTCSTWQRAASRSTSTATW